MPASIRRSGNPVGISPLCQAGSPNEVAQIPVAILHASKVFPPFHEGLPEGGVVGGKRGTVEVGVPLPVIH